MVCNMRTKVLEKERALKLRKQGLSYKDILQEIPVSKSSLSLWLSDLPLTPDEQQYLRVRRDGNISRGRIRAATVLHGKRLERDKNLLVEAKKEFALCKADPLFLVGIALYWAEGTKRGNCFHFINSDTSMIVVMLNWVERFCRVDKRDISLRLYIHRPYAHEHCEEYWSKHTGVALSNFKRTVYKPTALGIKKRPNYKGCVRIEVPRSSKYLRKLTYWQNMIVEHSREW